MLAPQASMTQINIDVKSTNTTLFFGVDESYSLDTSAAPAVLLTANTVFGALRGLETFSQLIDHNYYLTGAIVVDEPRFQHRGFMIDTARHFYPVELIYQHLDAMAYNKYNVLHWHIVDDQSFPYESATFPEMSLEGAFSPRHVYTYNDIQHIQQYALERGIRVVPEFDTPGHVTRGYEALTPNILTRCYRGGKPAETGPLDPTLNETFTFLDRFYSELQTVFWDRYAHIGGDEVLHWCWHSNPEIQAWLAAHPDIKDENGLEQYFVRNLLDILGRKGYSYTVWEEIFTNGGNIQPDTVIQVWKEETWQDVMTQVSTRGFKSVLSAPFYLNMISYGADWKKYYLVEPTDFNGGAAAEPSIAGLEACMWSEYIDSTNFIARAWPRASAVGERMWSTKETNNVEEAQDRLHEFRCKMVRRGINAQPSENGANMTALNGMNFCQDEWNNRYSPFF